VATIAGDPPYPGAPLPAPWSYSRAGESAVTISVVDEATTVTAPGRRHRPGSKEPSAALLTGVTLAFAILGDSIAYGQGASKPADTVGARLAADLTGAGTPTEVRVFAVPGATSLALAGQVQRATAWKPDLALIIVGANDLTRMVAPERAAAHLGDAVRVLRTAGAEVVVAPAPDLSVVPWVPQRLRMLVRAGSHLLQQAQTRAARAAGARVADIGPRSSAAFAADPALFCADRFHPSSAGYALIADALAPTVHAAASAALSRSARPATAGG
jgi:lysophospholipase L1-like esterase